MARDLTPKQERFVAEYLVDLNATQAAVRAGYSPKTAESIGRQQLRKTTVAQAIAKAKAKRASKSGRSAMDVLKDIQEVTQDAREQGDVKAALKGLELEGRHLGMFDDRLRVVAEARVVVIREGLPND